jgi:hypothetical protein
VQVETFYLSLRQRSKKERIQSLSAGSEDLYLASRWRTTKKDVAIVLPFQCKDICGRIGTVNSCDQLPYFWGAI